MDSNATNYDADAKVQGYDQCHQSNITHLFISNASCDDVLVFLMYMVVWMKMHLRRCSSS